MGCAFKGCITSHVTFVVLACKGCLPFWVDLRSGCRGQDAKLAQTAVLGRDSVLGVGTDVGEGSQVCLNIKLSTKTDQSPRAGKVAVDRRSNYRQLQICQQLYRISKSLIWQQ